MNSNNAFKKIAVVLGVVCVVIAGIYYNKNKSEAVLEQAQNFCESITPGKNISEVMELIGASAFEQLVFTDSTGQVVNAANKGTFSPAKSAGFTEGVATVSFAKNHCAINFKEGVVLDKTFTSGN
ncbi:hypothetical protein [Bdellovibrio sp. GT3]|uniref:hypothetical protein n=1 Tax=Bdellovibrio sp. GT3 TaxID=3136282 RepID=UPI0030F0434D